MTVRADLISEVTTAITVAAKVAPADYEGMAAAAVDAVAIFVFEQLASAPDAKDLRDRLI